MNMTNQLQIQEKRKLAHKLIDEGKSYREIMKALGYTSKSPIHNLLKKTTLEQQLAQAEARGIERAIEAIKNDHMCSISSIPFHLIDVLKSLLKEDLKSKE